MRDTLEWLGGLTIAVIVFGLHSLAVWWIAHDWPGNDGKGTALLSLMTFPLVLMALGRVVEFLARVKDRTRKRAGR